MKRVLVTGASGFVGRCALQPLRALGYEVHAVGRRVLRPEPGVTWHVADLLASGVPRAVVEKVRPSDLLHLAWYAEPGKFWRSALNLPWVGASLELLRAFRECGGVRVVTAGTCAEYDWSAGLCSEAITPCVPNTLYGASKHALAGITTAYAAQEGLSSAWGRLFFLYGPDEHPARLVPSVARALLRGDPALCTHGEQVRDFLHVGDVAEALSALLESRIEGPVNIASGVPVALKDVVKAIAHEVGEGADIRWGAIAAPTGEPRRLIADTARLQREVGWTPRHDLRSGIADTVRWWRRAP